MVREEHVHWHEIDAQKSGQGISFVSRGKAIKDCSEKQYAVAANV